MQRIKRGSVLPPGKGRIKKLAEVGVAKKGRVPLLVCRAGM